MSKISAYNTEQLRNMVLLGHGSSGKTSLAEAMLYNTGAINRLGKIEEGTTTSDYEEEEIRRGISLNLTVTPCEWKKHKINALDTPGFADFIGNTVSAAHVSDFAVIVADAVAGVEVGTELVWGIADDLGLPRAVVINKIDRDNANYRNVLAQLGDKFGVSFVPVILPVGEQADFNGIVDLVEMQAYMGEDEQKADIPPDMADEVEEARMALVEAAAEGDDSLMEKYFEEETLSTDEIKKGLKAAVKAGSVVPVICLSATRNLGVKAFMDFVLENMPAPSGEFTALKKDGEEGKMTFDPDGPLAAFVFRTIHDQYGKMSYFRVYSGTVEADSRAYNPRSGEEERIGSIFVPRGKEQLGVDSVLAGDIGAVVKLSTTETGDTLCQKDRILTIPPANLPSPLYSVAVAPRTQADSAKLGPSLTRLVSEDPTLVWRTEESTKQVLLEGMGDTHIDVSVKRLDSKFGLGVDVSTPKVPYRETITGTGDARYRHKKQTGGAGQFAEVWMRVEPLGRDEGFEYAWDVFGGAISRSFEPSILKGIKSVIEQGVIAGYPVVDVKAAVYDGKEHPVDSKDIAFQIAGREAFKEAFRGGNPVLLEPIMDLAVTIPEEYVGDVMGDLTSRRGRVQGTGQEKGNAIINAQVPLAEAQRYSVDLRSFTQGRGLFTMTFSHYELVPAHIQAEIIAAALKEKEEK